MEKTFLKSILNLDFVPCHRMPERSLFFRGKKFPICSRCLAILLGYLFIPFLIIFHFHILMYWGVLLCLPMVLDGYTQLKKWRMSNNYLRVITGLLSGFGQSVIVVSASLLLFNFLNSLS